MGRDATSAADGPTALLSSFTARPAGPRQVVDSDGTPGLGRIHIRVAGPATRPGRMYVKGVVRPSFSIQIRARERHPRPQHCVAALNAVGSNDMTWQVMSSNVANYAMTSPGLPSLAESPKSSYVEDHPRPGLRILKLSILNLNKTP